MSVEMRCPDIAYIGDLDDRSEAPDLTETTGAGLVPFGLMPHMNNADFRPSIDRILAGWPDEAALVKLNDDQAIVVEGERWQVVSSPEANLSAD